MNIFKPNSFISLKYSKEHISSLLTSPSVTDNILALRYILCKIQESYEYTHEFDTIIKLVDTTNPILKKLTNEYLRYYFYHIKDEDRKLLIVNTVLKDISDMEDYTMEYLVDFSTPSILQTYLPHITKYICKLTSATKNISTSKLDKIYSLAYRCDKIFNTSLVESIDPEYNITDYLNLVSLTHLKLPDDQILINLYNTDNLKYILRKICYDQGDVTDTSLYTILIKKDDLTTFYYTFQLIINNYQNISPEILQKAYDTSLIHMSTDNETLFHILILHESILDKIKYTNLSYLIYYSDPEYIKKQKIRILFNNLDDLGIREIRRHTYIEIVELSLIKECTEFEDVFYKNIPDDVIRALYKITVSSENQVCTRKLMYIVQKYLLHIIDKVSDMKEDVLRMFVYLCSVYLEEDSLPKIQANFNTILSYFLNLFRRSVLTKSEMITSLKKYTEYKDKIKTVSDLIINDVGSLLYFNDTVRLIKNQNVKIDLYNNLMDCKPYLESKMVKRISNKKPVNIFNTSKILIKSGIEYNTVDKERDSTVDTDIKRFSSLIKNYTLSTTEKVFIDHKFIKGVLSIRKRLLFLCIDVLEKDTVIEYTINKISSKITLSRESKVEISRVSINTDQVQIRIYEDIYNIKIDWKFYPNVVTRDEWEKMYNGLSKYKLVDKIDMTGVHQVDDERFSFRIFDEEVYGRIFNNQIILKGDEEIVKEFK